MSYIIWLCIISFYYCCRTKAVLTLGFTCITEDACLPTSNSIIQKSTKKTMRNFDFSTTYAYRSSTSNREHRACVDVFFSGFDVVKCLKLDRQISWRICVYFNFRVFSCSFTRTDCVYTFVNGIAFRR